MSLKEQKQRRRMYKDRFTESGQRIFDEALRESRSRNQNQVSIGHILYALISKGDELFIEIVSRLRVDLEELRGLIKKQVEKTPRYAGEGIRLAPEVIDLFKRALERARVKGRERIQATDLILACSQDEKGLLIETLKTFGVTAENIIGVVRSLTHEFEKKEARDSLDLPHAKNQQEKKSSYQVGETVRIKSGAFASLTGKVKAVNQEGSVLTVKVTVFNHPKEVEFKFSDVERVVFN
jgi:ATP-dependent Clp protease ATP-binding subunit ClpA